MLVCNSLITGSNPICACQKVRDTKFPDFFVRKYRKSLCRDKITKVKMEDGAAL